MRALTRISPGMNRDTKKHFQNGSYQDMASAIIVTQFKPAGFSRCLHSQNRTLHRLLPTGKGTSSLVPQ
jgi:hypothetical protein